jgi:biopolymer transport protein ExbD
MKTSLKNILLVVLIIACVTMLPVIYFKIVTVMDVPETIAASTPFSEPSSTTVNLDNIQQAGRNDFNQCIFLEKDKFSYIENGKKQVIAYSDMIEELKSKLKFMQSITVKIICTPETDYQNIVSVLDFMSDHNIKSYELLKS